MSERPLIVIGVSASSATYKVCTVVSLLIKNIDVHVVMTKLACEFVAPKSFAALTGNRVTVDLFEDPNSPDHPHIKFADRMSALLLAPATSNIIGKLANGISDDALSTLAISIAPFDKPCLVAPAMNTRMFYHPATQENLDKLKEWDYTIIGTDEGNLTCGWRGDGRLAKPQDIATAVFKALEIAP